MSVELDQADRRLLRLLQEDSSQSIARLAEQAGLTQTPCWRRVQRLREEGVIQRDVALVDRRKVGLDTQIFAQVRLTAQGRERIDQFAEKICSFPEVLECYVVMGSTDFLLRIVATDMHAYESFFFEKLSRVPGVQEISSMVALSEIKSTTAVPIPDFNPASLRGRDQRAAR